jgi:ribosomal protein S18 acetylase RimI-like enzyme
MGIDIREIGREELGRYGQIPISFRVESRLRVETIDGGFGGLRLTEELVEEPYVKDYDEFEHGNPLDCAKRFDHSRVHPFVAYDREKPVGAGIVVVDSLGACALTCRDDVAVVWDIRVHPDCRGQGIGSMLFDHAVTCAREQGCAVLAAETQNTNVPACRFYAGKGCYLGLISPCAYGNDPRVAHETMLLWCLDL